MQLKKQTVVDFIRQRGDQERVGEAEEILPDQIDTERDGEALASIGLDETQLMAKLAGGGYGGAVAP